MVAGPRQDHGRGTAIALAVAAAGQVCRRLQPALPVAMAAFLRCACWMLAKPVAMAEPWARPAVMEGMQTLNIRGVLAAAAAAVLLPLRPAMAARAVCAAEAVVVEARAAMATAEAPAAMVVEARSGSLFFRKPISGGLSCDGQ